VAGYNLSRRSEDEEKMLPVEQIVAAVKQHGLLMPMAETARRMSAAICESPFE